MKSPCINHHRKQVKNMLANDGGMCTVQPMPNQRASYPSRLSSEVSYAPNTVYRKTPSHPSLGVKVSYASQ
jgi:hypothetical protein